MLTTVLITVGLVVALTIVCQAIAGLLPRTFDHRISIPVAFALLFISMGVFSYLPRGVGLATGLIVVSLLPALLSRTIRSRSLNALRFSDFFSLIAISVYVAILFDGGLRFHTNPDIYGQLTSAAYLLDGGSVPELSTEFINLSGAKSAVWTESDMDIPSPWQIPDARVRFASDWLLGSGRIALSTLIAVVMNFFPTALQIAIFPHVLLAFLVFGAWLGSLLVTLLASAIGRGFSPRELDSKRSWLFLVARPAIVTALAISPIHLFQYVSGAATQLLFFVFILASWYCAAMATRDLGANGRVSISASFGGLVVGSAIVLLYPFGLVFHLVLWLIPTLSSLVSVKGARARQVLYVFLPVTTPLLAALLSFPTTRTTALALAKISAGNIGGGVHLGGIHLFEFLPLNWTRFPIAPGGWDGLRSPSDSTLLGAFALVLGVYLMFFLLIKSESSRPLLNHYLPAMVPIPLLLASLWQVTQASYFGANDYLIYRAFGSIGPIVLVILLASIGAGYRKLLRIWSRRHEGSGTIWDVLVAAITISTVVFQGANGHQMLVNYSEATSAIVPFRECPTATGEVVYLSDQPDQRVFALALCGPTFYLTDNWEPTFIDSLRAQVVVVTTDGDTAHFSYGGTTLIPEDFSGPCDTSCYRQLDPDAVP